MAKDLSEPTKSKFNVNYNVHLKIDNGHEKGIGKKFLSPMQTVFT